MQTMQKTFVFMALAGLLAATSASAEELTKAALGLCEKVKSCAMQEIAEQDLTPEMRQMMQPMLDNMCTTMQQGIGEIPTGHELYKPAVACMRSMEQLSCEQMQNQSDQGTPECQKYAELAEQAGYSQQ